MKPIPFLVLSSLLLLTISLHPCLAAEVPVTRQVMILDENGSVLPSAHVYIFSQNKKKFYGTQDAHGTTTFDLPSGEYRVYAALTKSTNGNSEHFSSPEAHVSLNAEEPTSIILSLQKAEVSEFYLSDTARQKMGIGDELANNLN